MKRIITTAALCFAAFANLNAQTTAPNWTASDCSSTNHTLHTELDNGKVVVLVWVMPCGSCVGPAKTAYNAVQNFVTSDPGKVVYYMADDYGDASCAALNSWVTSNSIGDPSKINFFSNSGNAINMNSFGGDGMPKVVVMVGTSHTIFFNKNNASANDAAGINAAITSALDAATHVESLNKAAQFSLSPNPVADRVSINYGKPVVGVTITGMNGQIVKEVSYTTGKMNPVIDVHALPAGVYMLKMTDSDNATGIQKIVKE